MRPHAARHVRAALVPAALCLAALATLGFPGCPERPTEPKVDSSKTLTMSNCWPNDDGRTWHYSGTLQYFEPQVIEWIPPDQQVPEATIALARQLLATPVGIEYDRPASYGYMMSFQGMRTSPSGVEGQYLLENVDVSGLSGRPAISSSTFARDFLERPGQARPDLRARIAAAGVKLEPRPNPIHPTSGTDERPTFIHGGLWLKGATSIGTYGDADTSLAWKFLEADVQPGHSFRHKLVQWRTGDVWLVAEVDRVVEAEVQVSLGEYVTVSNAIEVLYVVDYGVSEAKDGQGNVVGRFRTFDYGRVTYAPGIGPFSDVERRNAHIAQNVTKGNPELRLGLWLVGGDPYGTP